MERLTPSGWVAESLYFLPRRLAWFAIVVIISGIAWADFSFPYVGMGPFYLLLICGAAWSLGGTASFIIAIVVAVLTTMPAVLQEAELTSGILAVKLCMRLVCFGTVAIVINSFRRSFQRERYRARRDTMTGALNHQVFYCRAGKRIEAAGRSNAPLLLVILDLDDFKAINSTHGHGAGDAVLRTFADSLSAIVRREDLVGRLGGDEFGLLLDVPSVAEGQGFARSIHLRLSSLLAQGQYPLTCSMGALLIPPAASRNLAELMHAADLAMYQAKHAGKNSVRIVRADKPIDNSASGIRVSRRHRTV
ncbi:diguanylate cyclase [Sphingobium yanoikuyae]|uniref:diguanylate cyclase n=2 Tax=Sphingobium TaxID=165695 RepID=A0A6P1GDX5_SPHYA|nr:MULTISPECIES: GGDEF domain-containing protein [Sphingobium]MBB4152000.1 diguanylate cyclase (GGDEF)-like protein [Sphingobium scionense]QHD66452.1 diguanylate cyclase [Sphingobium yanoikuyae]QJR02140.1 GGDEF domain-containing protein [Sphingobium yanoikuyae]QNG48198.1 GGDEF domain-containing protein [Sphingobium yanoikuyae]